MSVQKIFKYTIDEFKIGEKFILQMPEGASVINVDFQNEKLAFWAEVEDDTENEERPFVVFFTGDIVKSFDDYSTFHLKTLIAHNGHVYHVYELL